MNAMSKAINEYYATKSGNAFQGFEVSKVKERDWRKMKNKERMEFLADDSNLKALCYSLEKGFWHKSDLKLVWRAFDCAVAAGMLEEYQKDYFRSHVEAVEGEWLTPEYVAAWFRKNPGCPIPAGVWCVGDSSPVSIVGCSKSGKKLFFVPAEWKVVEGSEFDGSARYEYAHKEENERVFSKSELKECQSASWSEKYDSFKQKGMGQYGGLGLGFCRSYDPHR